MFALQALVQGLQEAVEGKGLAASSYLLLLETMYQLGTCSGAASSSTSSSGDDDNSDSSSDAGDCTEEEDAAASDGDADADDPAAAAAEAAAEAWAIYDKARRRRNAGSSSSGSRPVTLPTSDCKEIQQAALSVLPTADAVIVQQIFGEQQQDVHAAAEVAAQIIRGAKAAASRRAVPNVPLGTVAAAADLSLAPEVTQVAYQSLGKFKKAGSTATRVQIDGVEMQSGVNVCKAGAGEFIRQMGAVLEAAGSNSTSGKLASVLQLSGAVLTQYLAASTEQHCSGAGIRLQVGMLRYGKGAFQQAAGECMLGRSFVQCETKSHATAGCVGCSLVARATAQVHPVPVLSQA